MAAESHERRATTVRRAVLVALFASGVFGTQWWQRWPDVARLADTDPTTWAVVERAAGQGAAAAWTWTPLRDISPQLALAVLVAEDIEFFQHDGFSLAEIRLAVEEVREGRRLRGASTITQQLAKNLWLSSERSVVRKAQEAVLTVDLERFLSKPRILELYLNVVQFGPGVFGAEEAARRFFHKPSLFLTEHESASLAAGLTRPSLWYPGVAAAEYVERTELVRRRMTNAEFLWRHLLHI